LSRQRLSSRNIRRGLTILTKIFWKIGILGDYRKAFWKFTLPRLVRGDFENLLSSVIVAHHLIMFARDACSGRGNASHYSAKLRQLEEPITL
jgi:hypothetical protein